MDLNQQQQQQLWVKRSQTLDKLKTIKILDQKELVVEKNLMDHALYELATKDNADLFIEELQYSSGSKQISLITILDQVTLTGNTLLHVAAASGSKDITQLLAYHFPDNLIPKKNLQGDTALHAAARAGELATAMILVDVAKNYGGFLGMKNKKGNTCLHEAVSNGNKELAKFLVSIEPQLAYCRNFEGVEVAENVYEGKSPLYIAAQNGETDIFGILLQAIAQDHHSLQRLEGKSPAHASIEKRNIAILEEIAAKKPELLRAKETGGNNALHLASNVGYVAGVKFLLNSCFDCAIETNMEGLYPIHVACRQGHVEVLEELLNEVKWPEPMEFLTEKEGQNILHVAASHGRERAARVIVENDKFNKLLNQKDINGNTPLHLAAKNSRPATTYALLENKNIDYNIVNNQNLTPYGESLKQTNQLMLTTYSLTSPAEEKNHQDPETSNQMKNNESNPDPTNQTKNKQSNEFREDMIGMMTFATLHYHGKPKDQGREYLLSYLQRKSASETEIRSRVEVLLVAAVLVAGVAFGGVTQVPGGEAAATSHSILYPLYYICTSASLFLSISASNILCWVQLYDVISSTYAIRVASIMIGHSFYFMFMAFSMAILIDARAHFLLVIVLQAIGVFIYCTVFSLFYFAMICRAASPHIYYLMFWVYFLGKKAFRWLIPSWARLLFTCLLCQKVT